MLQVINESQSIEKLENVTKQYLIGTLTANTDIFLN